MQLLTVVLYLIYNYFKAVEIVFSKILKHLLLITFCKWYVIYDEVLVLFRHFFLRFERTF